MTFRLEGRETQGGGGDRARRSEMIGRGGTCSSLLEKRASALRQDNLISDMMLEKSKREKIRARENCYDDANNKVYGDK